MFPAQLAHFMFPAQLDRRAKLTSAFVIALLTAAPLFPLRSNPLAAALLALFSILVIALAYAYSPRGYEISGSEFRIKRLLGDLVFPLDGIRFVRDASPNDLHGCVRFWGSDGLFGYYGLFWSNALGRSRWYLTDRHKALVLSNQERFILVSPENQEAFIAALQQPQASAPPPATPRPAPAIRPTLLVIILFLLPLPAVFLYNPGKPPLQLTRNALVILSPFYGLTVPASTVQPSGIRVVDLTVEPGWKSVLRTNGFRNFYFSAGNFRTANGQSIKLFSTGAQQLVLLPPSQPDGTPILLDTADPHNFVAQIRQLWRPN